MDLLHAHGDSPLSLRLSRLVPFAIRIYSLRSCHPSANPPNCAIGEFLPLSLSIKKPHLWWSFFMERETRLVSCSVACNGIPRFANVILSKSQNATASAPSRNSQKSFIKPLSQQIKRPLELKSYGLLISGRRGSNSRHPPWQGGILPLNYPRIGLLC